MDENGVCPKLSLFKDFKRNIMKIHWVEWGTLFSERPKSRIAPHLCTGWRFWGSRWLARWASAVCGISGGSLQKTFEAWVLSWGDGEHVNSCQFNIFDMLRGFLGNSQCSEDLAWFSPAWLQRIQETAWKGCLRHSKITPKEMKWITTNWENHHSRYSSPLLTSPSWCTS